MGEVAVVTCFLLRRSARGDRLLLLRRSQEVGTYRGRWAGVSGYLEGPAPLPQAYRELAEEVGLGPQDVRLLAQGSPLAVPDPRLGRRWLVHPFLFEVTAPGRLRLDWEHVACRWIRPSQVFRFATVPMLPEALMRVYPLVPPSVAEAVERIRADRRQGARQLAAEALRALLAVAEEVTAAELRASAQALARCRPSMAAVGNSIAAAYAAIPAETGTARAAIEDLLRGLEGSTQAIIPWARQVLPGKDMPGTVVTYSYSSTVVEVLAALGPQRVIVSEGRPLLEGRSTARALAQQGIAVTIITEAQLGLFVGEAQAVAVGADTVLPDGSFVNKAGTGLLALAARAAGVPLYVLSETAKVAPSSLARAWAPEEGDPREVAPEEEAGLEARNLSFEATPGRLVRAYVTEEGLRAPREMRLYARRAEASWRRLFGRAPGRGPPS